MKKVSHLKEDCVLLLRAAFWVCLVAFILAAASAGAQDGGLQNRSASGYVTPATAGDDLWPMDGAYPFVTADSIVHLVSSSANDASAGTGCRTVLLTGVDGDYNVLEETLTTNGTTVVDSSSEFLRLNEAKCLTVGSGGVNAGAISIYITGSSLGQIPASEGKTQQAIYTAPLDRKVWLKGYNVQVSHSSVSVDLQMRENGKSWVTLDFNTANTGSGSDKDYQPWMVVPRKADLRLRVNAVGSSVQRAQGSLELIEQR